jgi:hypothetical protein
MAPATNPQRMRELRELLPRDHTLNGGVLFGLEGHIIEIQARAMEVLKEPASWRGVTKERAVNNFPTSRGLWDSAVVPLR